MGNVFNLKPELLWKHFTEICSIPHPSKHEQQIIQYIVDFARNLDLKCIVDSSGNVLIRKNGTTGKNSSPIIILQSHLDMVPQKNELSRHNFLTDPIKPVIDGAWVRAQGTTLGADNGIGVAAMLAILESTDLIHGPIEALFTIDEETGMIGVKNLEPGLLQGKRLINLDTENDSELCVGCAGGIDSIATMKLQIEPTPGQSRSYKINLKGLLGGHSGVDIHLGRANAIKLMARILFTANEQFTINISTFHGGTVRNAIPREAFAIITAPIDFADSFEQWIVSMNAVLRDEFGHVEPNLALETTQIQTPKHVLTRPAQSNLLLAIYACPNGVFRMSNRFEGVVETSNNISIIVCENGNATIECLTRSSIESSRDDCANAVFSALSLGGAHVDFQGKYPGWKPNPSSKLLECMQKVYKNTFSKDAHIHVVHAGLECGLIGAAYPDMDMVSCGPTIRFPHSPDEQVHIDSVSNFWSFLTTLLEQC